MELTHGDYSGSGPSISDVIEREELATNGRLLLAKWRQRDQEEWVLAEASIRQGYFTEARRYSNKRSLPKPDPKKIITPGSLFASKSALSEIQIQFGNKLINTVTSLMDTQNYALAMLSSYRYLGEVVFTSRVYRVAENKDVAQSPLYQMQHDLLKREE